VYAGTEPSALHTSNDGGGAWERMMSLNDLPSSKSWSFPPRPWTHHVTWIEHDANNSDDVFAAIETGPIHNKDKSYSLINVPVLVQRQNRSPWPMAATSMV
jgi:hypothetical protein